MRAKKRFGQNFLRDERVIDKIIDSLDLRAGDRVLEIGPGEGVLTERILERDVKLIAIEIDRDLVPILRSRFGDKANFEVIEGDILSTNLAETLPAGDGPLKIVGNLPYYISTPILEHMMAADIDFERLVLMLQREVVERITAPPGNSDRGYFTVLIENAFDCELVLSVPPSAFRPAPAVDSAVVRLRPKERAITDDRTFRSLLSASFAQKRKTIKNNLRRYSPDVMQLLQTAGIDPSRRAETLSLEEWKSLNDQLNPPTRGQ
jgi:16S rRNA (adenine1518-N6/adenine1519-N6)-dimethyltransferase